MKNKFLFITVILVIFVGFFSFYIFLKNDSVEPVLLDLDIDFNNAVLIGGQTWMNENLDIAVFRNGDTIFLAKTPMEWIQAAESQMPACCYYNFNANNAQKNGRLYNWYAVNDSRGLAPEGWRIPTDSDWIVLTDYLGGELIAARSLKFVDSLGMNNSRINSFEGRPSGAINEFGDFSSFGLYGYWWSASELDSDYAWSRYVFFELDQVFRFNILKTEGISVRCIK